MSTIVNLIKLNKINVTIYINYQIFSKKYIYINYRIINFKGILFLIFKFPTLLKNTGKK